MRFKLNTKTTESITFDRNEKTSSIRFEIKSMNGRPRKTAEGKKYELNDWRSCLTIFKTIFGSTLMKMKKMMI